MVEPLKIIESALKEGRATLSEYESKMILSHYRIPIVREKLCKDLVEIKETAQEIGYPLAMKGNSPRVTHKTEKGLIRLDVRNEKEAEAAFLEIMDRMDDRTGTILVQEMLKGQREFLAGLTRDPQFGPCVLFGLGGIFAEILEEVSFRIAPLDRKQALAMMEETKANKMLGAVRGMEPADKDLMADILIRLGQIGLELEEIKEIDINPLIISGAKPVAADALIVLAS